MSLYGALYSGVSGLAAESSAMGAIADNVSNINTVGYKGTDVNFNTLVTQQVSLTEYSPGGVESAPRAAINVQGLLQATSSSTDMAISGQGFFIVNSSADPSIDGGEFAYTRAGSFTTNQNGYLVNTAGYYLMGWPLTPTDNTAAALPTEETINGTVYMKAYKNADGTTQYINQNIVSDTDLQPLNLNDLGGTAEATSNISLGLNLPAGAPIYNPSDPTGGLYDSDALVYNSLGDSSNVQLQWTKIAANSWSLTATPPQGAAVVNLTSTSATGTTQIYSSAGQLEFQSIPPLGSQFTLSSTVGTNTSPTYVQVQFYNSQVQGFTQDPTTDTGTAVGTASNPYVIGVNLADVTDTAGVATAVQDALQSAANTPTQNNTFNISQVLLGGVSTGGERFVANGSDLEIEQQPGAAAVTVNCSAVQSTPAVGSSPAVIGLGSSILESGTGIGSGATTTGPNATAGIFTVEAINSGFTQSDIDTEATNFTVDTPPSTSGVNTFDVTATPPTGNLTMTISTGSTTTASLSIPWGATGLSSATSPIDVTLNGATVSVDIPNPGATTAGELAENAAAVINELAQTPSSGMADVAATSNANGQVILGSTTSTLSTVPATTSGTTWLDGTSGANAESVTPQGSLQIGTTEIPWSQITSGQVFSTTDSATGVTTDENSSPPFTPISLTYQPVATSDALTINTTPSGATGNDLVIGPKGDQIEIPYSQIEAGQITSVINAQTGGTITPSSPLNLPNTSVPAGSAVAGDVDNLAANIASAVTQLAADPNTSSFLTGLTATNTTGTNTVTFDSTTQVFNVTADLNGTATDTTWSTFGSAANGDGTTALQFGAVNATQAAQNTVDAITGLGSTALSGVTAKVDSGDAATVDLSSGATPVAIYANNGGVAGDIMWQNGTDASVLANTQMLGQTATYIADSQGAAMTFNGDGTPSSIIPTTMQLYWADGAENQDTASGNAVTKPEITLNLGSLNESNGVTQLSDSSDNDIQVNFVNQDGAQFGSFSGVSIGSNGVVTALFSNGVREPVFQIPLATFPNPDGLQSESGNVYVDTTTSGSYTLQTAGNAGSGTISESSLEASTVDLGTEFTQMITVQRAYSAAAKIITTTDQMLSDLINVIPQ